MENPEDVEDLLSRRLVMNLMNLVRQVYDAAALLVGQLAMIRAQQEEQGNKLDAVRAQIESLTDEMKEAESERKHYIELLECIAARITKDYKPPK